MSSTMRTPRTEGENGKPAAIREKMRRAAHGVLGWRNWSLPVKLAAVTLVPVLFAVVLGALQISAQVGSAGQYAQITKVITLGDQVRDTLHAVQRERNAAAVAKGRNEQDIKKAFGPADSALTALRGAVGDPAQYGNAIAQQWQRADFQLRRISTARSYWGTDVDQALRDYDQVARGLLGFDRALAGGVREAALVQRADALYDVSAAREEISQQQALVLAGIARSSLTAGEISDLRDSRARLVSDQNDFVAVADPADNARYQHTVSGSDVNRRGYLLSEAISSTPTERLANNSDAATGTAASPPGTRPLQVSTASWNAASNGTARKLGTASNSLAAGLHDAAGALQSSATTAAVVAAVVLLVMLVLAAVIVVVVARQLLRSIRTLHRSAREVAEITLPEVVEEIRQGRPVEERIINVEVDSDDEVGQLARAFDAVHLQARRLAVEQAALRANYSSVFVNLSRRSQSLVQRQLRLIEQLERDEEDPDQLGTLFQLDHLATRMRRNNENLMVLSGAETSRGVNQQPVAVSDLLRAAVSEVEQYQRVVVAPPPTAHVLGYACADLVRLIAELLDNATAFSAPTTQVSVLTVLESDGSVTLEVVDEGVGMREQELADANARLYGDSVDEVPLSRRMGLFVVGRLAERHDFAVELFGGTDVIGLRASVTVPAELVLGSADRVRLSDTGSNPVVPTLPAAAAPFTPIRRGASAARPEPSQTGGSSGGDAASASKETSEFAPVDAAATTRFPPLAQAGGSSEQASAAHADAHATETRAVGRTDGAMSQQLFAAGAPADVVTPTADEPVDAPTPSGPERTPIYDAMLPVWFAAPSTDADHAWRFSADTDTPTPLAQGSEATRWRFAADAGWQAVEAVAEVEPESYTASGLPKRAPRARLLPGSASPAPSASEAQVRQRDAASVRRRMNSYQRGLNQGRTAQHRAPGSGDSAQGDPSGGADIAAAFAPENATPATAVGTNGATHGGGANGTDDAGAEVTRWRFATDVGWQAVRSAQRAEPEVFTASGLPKRNPRARLVPGSATENADQPRAAGEFPAPRDPQDVRNRMSSFQRGLREGRHSIGVPAAQTTPDGELDDTRRESTVLTYDDTTHDEIQSEDA